MLTAGEKAGGQKNRYEDLFFVLVACFINDNRQLLNLVKLPDKFGLLLSFYYVAKEHNVKYRGLFAPYAFSSSYGSNVSSHYIHNFSIFH